MLALRRRLPRHRGAAALCLVLAGWRPGLRIDAFTLMRHDGVWRITSLAYANTDEERGASVESSR